MKVDQLDKKPYLKISSSMVTILIFLTAQTLTGVVWATRTTAIVTTKLDYMQMSQDRMQIMIENNTKDRYTRSQAMADNSSLDRRITKIENDYSILNTRVIEYQARIK